MTPNYTAVLFSAGLDSAVLLADALTQGPAEAVYVGVGFAWENEERAMAARLLGSPPFTAPAARTRMVELAFDMRDVFPASHWAVRGEPPAFDTPDEDVYLEGRNLILLTKTAVHVARTARTERATGVRLRLGTLAGNPFPDATPAFFEAAGRALSLGLDRTVTIEAPFAGMHKADVVRRGVELGVPFELTMSCMQPDAGRHCGRCSKCRERRDAFRDTGIVDPTPYRQQPLR